MLAIVGCECHNGITMSQAVLREAGVSTWLTAPSYRGKQHGLAFVRSLPVPVVSLDKRLTLGDFLEHNSSYSVIVGYNETAGRFVNVGRGDMRSKAEAMELAKLFA